MLSKSTILKTVIGKNYSTQGRPKAHINMTSDTIFGQQKLS